METFNKHLKEKLKNKIFKKKFKEYSEILTILVNRLLKKGL
jgi:hypothetical protein